MNHVRRPKRATVNRCSMEHIAEALLHRDLTPARLLKLRRHLADDPWRNGRISETKVAALLDAIEKHPSGGENTRAFVHEAIVNQPARALPPLPPDIAQKIEAFEQERARRAESKGR